MSQNFKDSLHLPKTDFPMKANLAKREPEFLSFWKERDIYGKLMEERKHAPLFVLHDGPPYANGNIHIGTAFNKILKDLIPKYKWMRGFRAPYVPGWDTHGLPIELRVLKDEGLAKDDVSPAELRTRCTSYAMKYLDVQRNEFKRLGVLGDWDAPYVTFEPEYEAAQLGVFAEMVEKGLVYKGHKPVFWCVDCQTALAAAEIEVSPSIFVAYPLKDVAARFDVCRGKDVSVVIWTTTPWTLPASMAVALHPEYIYVFAPSGDGRVFLLAKDLVPQFVMATKLSLQDPLLTCTGKELEGLFAEHPFYGERSVPLVLADYVLLDQGTGCVHTAPGHGVEDFETGIRYGLEIFNPVDDRGFFLEETPLVGGLSLEKGAERVLEVLRGNTRLLGSGKVKHSYPHCWRCKNPVIFRSTRQWFVSVAAFKEATLEEIAHVRWVPAWGEERITNMVRDRSDWCISRQRIWGVPIPAFVCEECGELVVSPDRVRRVQEKVRLMGSNIWWENSPEELAGAESSGRKRTSWMYGSTPASAIGLFWRHAPSSSGLRISISREVISTGAGFRRRSSLPWRRKERRRTNPFSLTVSLWTGRGEKCPNPWATSSFLRRSSTLTVRMCCASGSLLRIIVMMYVFLRRSSTTWWSLTEESEILRDSSLAISTGSIRRNTLYLWKSSLSWTVGFFPASSR
jgi:isoleucyl-tRNA synthetase